jgi:Fic family protein
MGAMARFEARVWQPDPDRRPRTYQAFVPDPIADLDRPLPLGVQERCETAARLLAGLGRRLPVAWEPVARLLLRTEGMASSQIEGLQVPAQRLLAAQLDPAATDATARWVFGNIEAVEQAVRESDRPLSIERVLAWHRRLMRHSGLPARYVGRLRAEPSWIGGTTPLDAAYVPPPHEAVEELLDDLVIFANRADLPAVAQAAIAHAQFEVIHPFGDGNGRVGRALIGWVLRRRGVIDRVVPPISPILADQRGAYLAGLYEYRQGAVDRWVGWFAEIAIAAAARFDELVARAEGLARSWTARLADLRADAAARRLLPHLVGTPVLDVPTAARLVGASQRAIRTALGTLAERGILSVTHRAATGPGRPGQLWIAADVLKLFD